MNNDELLLFCSNFEWVAEDVDSSTSAKITVSLSALAILSLLLYN